MTDHRDLELLLPLGTSLVAWYQRVLGPGTTPPSWNPRNPPDAKPVSAPSVQSAVAALGAADRARTCAELDSLASWVSSHPERAKRVRAIRLIRSDTEVGAWVASVLSKLVGGWMPSDKVEVDTHLAPRLSASASMGHGLRGFVHLLGRLREGAKSRGRHLVVNATAGYKVESGLALLFGALSGSEVFYLHEAMKDAVSFPAFPIDWSLDTDEQAILSSIGAVADTDTARELDLGRRPRLWPFVEEADGCWGLTALGELATATLEEGLVELRTREGEVRFEHNASERGHEPEHAPRTATEIGARLPFVTRARLVGWPRGSAGLLREHPSEQTSGRVGLRFGSGPHEGTALEWLLDTTANTEPEWKAARRKIGEAFGRLSLEAQLTEDAVAAGAVPAEFAALAVEEMLRQRLLATERDERAASERADELERRFSTSEARRERDRQQLEGVVAQRDGELVRAREQLEQSERRLAEEHKAVASLRRELERQRSEDDSGHPC